MLCFDFDAVALKKVDSIFSKAFVEHGENLGSYVIDCDLDVRYKGWVELFQILVAEVEELGRKFNTGSYIC